MSAKLAGLELQVLSLREALRDMEASLGPRYVIPHRREDPEPKGRVRRHKLYDQKAIEDFKDGVNCYWLATTGKHIHFEFNKFEQPFITPTYHAFRRNELIYELLKCRCEGQPWIADLCAGTGMDLLSMLMTLGAKRIDYVDSATYSSKNTFEHGLENIVKCVQEFDELEGRVDFIDQRQFLAGGPQTILGSTAPGRTLIVPCNMELKEYFRRLPRGSHPNLVNIDPPFFLKGEFEATDEELVEWFVENVLDPMELNGITADYFCIKSRATPAAFKRLLAKSHPKVTYVAVEACAPYRTHINEEDVAEGRQTKGVFYWIFFATDIMRAGVYTNDDLWDDLVLNGKDVVVDKRKWMRPIFPSYTKTKVPGEVIGGVEGGNLVKVERKIKAHRGGGNRRRTPADTSHFRRGMAAE